jgi:phenylacetate-CoA ligase
MVASLRKRLPSPQQIYMAAPRPAQRLLANIEAWRRDSLRRYGDFAAEVSGYDPAWYGRTALPAQEAYQLGRLREVVAAARSKVPHYRRTLPADELRSLDDLRHLPIVEKSQLRQEPRSFVADGVATRALWLQSTSGSTGTPLRYYHDREITRGHQAVADALLASIGCRFGERRVRISGVMVAPYAQTRPPFWMYIDVYHQLQCSAYHLTRQTSAAYLDAMRAAGVRYGTGYATAWHMLATFILEGGARPPALRAIVTDSEGISPEQQATVERAFGCPVYQTYGLGETGQVAMQCAHRRYHVLTQSVVVELLDDAGQPVRSGEIGQIVVTDLTATVTPFIRYRTGDLATSALTPCGCGWHSPSWQEVVGRIDDRVLTPDGRWIGRLSHVTKPGVGIRESQIAQTALNHVVIRVVPDRDFDPQSMEAVVRAAHTYLGAQMQVTWEQVPSLPRTRAGKLRHVVREFSA